jgi:uncharacterized protein YbjT (DUF2867 family)
MKALIIGATGLVGKEILKLTLEDSIFSAVTVFVRRSTGLVHPKFKEIIVDFDDLDSWNKQLDGDVLFSAMGTTLKAAGSKEAQYQVDYRYQFNVAAAARENGVRAMVLISSTGADAHSRFFYLSTKGKLEEAVKEIGFMNLVILRPGPLIGARDILRPAEILSSFFLSKIPKIKRLSRLLPVHGHQVAVQSIRMAKQQVPGVLVLEASDILF